MHEPAEASGMNLPGAEHRRTQHQLQHEVLCYNITYGQRAPNRALTRSSPFGNPPEGFQG